MSRSIQPPADEARSTPLRPRELVAAFVATAAARVLVEVLLVRAGFSHISDDDFSRTVIAERWVHDPAWDASGTSWLPFPFWWTGAWMGVLGRSVETARAASIALGAIAAGAYAVALRRAGLSRGSTAFATAIAIALPWSLWTGAAPVPEAFVGPFVAAVAIDASARRLRPSSLLFLTVACLSRYEAWPVALAVGVLAAWRAHRAKRPLSERVLWPALSLIGPLAWIAWNAHAHGDPIHFFVRVSRYKRALDAAHGASLIDKLASFPRLVGEGAPVAACLLAVGAVALVGWPPFRSRWVGAFAAAAAQIAFLIVGNLGDGAATHHPERALIGVWWIGIALGAHALERVARGHLSFATARVHRALAAAVPIATTLGMAALLWEAKRDHPGLGPDDRANALAEGERLRRDGARQIVVRPCHYEHFALIASFGAPERISIAPRREEADDAATCPEIVRADGRGPSEP